MILLQMHYGGTTNNDFINTIVVVGFVLLVGLVIEIIRSFLEE